ncbi:MAG TPA: hypothetical protein VK601_00715 [Kofleriaceae bacterium]|nr:hypothetical protein [Kofleriaceae bacterium]
MSKDRARPFSRKHRRYWIPVTGGMILIGLVDLALGYCSYTPPSEVHERIVPDVPNVAGRIAPAPAAVACAPDIASLIAAEVPGATIIACAADRVTVLRGERRIDLALAGGAIAAVAETLTLPEIPAAVMRAFAVAYPRTIPSGAIKRTRRGAGPIYELAFPPGAGHTTATLLPDGAVIDLR